MALAEQFSPGDLVRARGREWVVVNSERTLRLRPLSGSDKEIETILPEIEKSPVEHARFSLPSGEHTGGRDAAQLLSDALRLSLRRGAGPFRGAGRINFEPRAYQLAPLMMALRQEVVRLLNADDVGVGKTIETGLILREFVDRGEIDQFTVLCPPHLIDQWTRELEEKFSFQITPVTASAASRLERNLSESMSVFEAYPFTVVSLDFVKSDRRFDDFVRACPNMVVIDEVHSAVSSGQRRQRRYELVRELARDPERHMIFLTATPHSGNDEAFHNLLGLIDTEFNQLVDVEEDLRRKLRERLANHFIQRRRMDIQAWQEDGLFPQHFSAEKKYQLSGRYNEFHEKVLEYCADTIMTEGDEYKQRLAFWGTLALMRCVCSSPSAAVSALRSRISSNAPKYSEAYLAANVLDNEEMVEDDIEPNIGIEDESLADLIAQAEQLSKDTASNPKFQELVKVLKELIKEGFSSVVFCRYIATAESVGDTLKSVFNKFSIDVITGLLPSNEREQRVEQLGKKPNRILIATDCLSEGINLQSSFDAVVHYDLCWNPTRHQQREGRVDRFGQISPTVRSVLIYGENNPIDGAVLSVILRKATRIEKQTGVRIPIPDDSGSLMRALMSAVLLQTKESRQTTLEFEMLEPAVEIETKWRNASEHEKKSRTIFAQNTLKPDDVIPEWRKTMSVFGGYEDVERFVTQAMKRLNATLEPLSSKVYRAPVQLVPENVFNRLESEGFFDDGSVDVKKIGFTDKSPPGVISVHRAHSLPTVLAETFLEQTLDGVKQHSDLVTLPRTGAWESDGVDEVTWLAIIRIRHRLRSLGKLGPKFNMAEEAAAIAFSSTTRKRLSSGPDAFALLNFKSYDLPSSISRTELKRLVDFLPNLMLEINTYAAERAEQLSEDHTRVRRSLRSRAQMNIKVKAITPVDIIGVYLLMPTL